MLDITYSSSLFQYQQFKGGLFRSTSFISLSFGDSIIEANDVVGQNSFGPSLSINIGMALHLKLP